MKRNLAWALAAMLILNVVGCNQKKTEGSVANTDKTEVAVADETVVAQEVAAEVDEHAGHDHGDAKIAAPLDVAAAPADAIKTDSGLAYKMLKTNADGKSILEEDLVSVHYTGWTTDGEAFDSTRIGGTPAVFTPSQLIPGMKEALILGKTGEEMRVWIPANLAYADVPQAPQGMLVFDFQIVDVITPVMPPKDSPEDAIKLDNGVAYRVIKANPEGAKVQDDDILTLEFTAWLQADSARLHSSKEIGAPLVIPVSKLMPGWQGPLKQMRIGEVAQLWVPQELGLDPEGLELKGSLIFEMEIVKVLSMPQTPADVAAPPADAEKTASGLASQILKAGTGEHPTDEDRVEVNYTGWTTDGEMFDSSYVSGQTAVFPLANIIAGWQEGLKLMKVGETRRLWIPEDLAYKGADGAPKGMLVFDIELIQIL